MSDLKSLDHVNSSVDTTAKQSQARRLLAFIGPAYLISVGYMDPGNWATDIAAGSAFGYELIWVLLMSNLIALLLQNHCVRLGIVYRHDLAQASRRCFPKHINYVLYGLSEIAIAATDLAEVLGLAIGLNLLFHIPILYGVLIAVFDSILILFILSFGIRKMEAFIISLVFTIGLSFFVELLFSKPDMLDIMNGFKPYLRDENALYIAIGIIGATVMPHNLYLHSALVQTRKFSLDPQGIKRALKYNFIDTAIALNLAFFVNASILILAATVFFKNGYFNIVSIEDAHKMLEPLLGTSLAPTLFGIALIAAGQSSTITGTLAGQIVMEGYISLRIAPWLRRLITRFLAAAPAAIVIYLFGENETGKMLIFSQVLLSLQLAFAVIPLIRFVSNKEMMNDFVVSPTLTVVSWICALIIIALNITLVQDVVREILFGDLLPPSLVYLLIFPLLAFLLYVLIFITITPIKHNKASSSVDLREVTIMQSQPKRRIAVTLDFSAGDTAAIQQAIEVGGKEALYILIHVSESAVALFSAKESHDKEEQEDLRKLNHYVEQLQSKGYNALAELGHGKRVREIIAILQKQNADLLVMGAHGHGSIKDLIFGQTINALRHRIPTPILIVKQ